MKLSRLRIAAVVFLASFHFAVQAQDFSAVQQLAQRRVPWLAPHLQFSRIPMDSGKDVFEITSLRGNIQIAASGPNAAAMGLSWYLKYYCHRSMSHLGDNLSPVLPLPAVGAKVREVAAFPMRYALNYCTINYTMSFYTWTDWERELDWMALSGVNLLLAPVGTEEIWQNALKRMGFSRKEIFDFIPGPAFTAWWLMGNLEGWGGPVTQNMIDRQALLQNKILKRMKRLGIAPILQGFYGMVPAILKTKTKSTIIQQGKWGKFIRPDILLPTDTGFERVAGIYYQEMKKLYGEDIHYFGGDPFHEGGNSKGADMAASAREIQRIMQQQYPGSTWILQGWQSNPSKELLDGVDKSKTLVLELFGENTNNWEQRKGYDGTPFIWSNVSNFGEKTGLNGKLQRFASEVWRAKHSSYGSLLKGVGIIPEGINNNPVAFDLMLELGWHNDSIDVSRWLRQYVQYRYGVDDEAIQDAWQQLLQTVYSSPDVYQEGPPESIFCARPGMDLKTVSSWGTRKRNYDTALFTTAVKTFVAVAGKFKNNETYQTDKTDFLRQLNANKGDVYYREMMDAIKGNDEPAYQKTAAEFVQLLLSQDSLLSRSKYFSLSTWLNAAADFGKTEYEKKLSVKNAKTQITYWGNDDPATALRDYAHKEWGGLLSSLYLQRWRYFIAHAFDKTPSPAGNVYFEMERKWASLR
jgi:alpha-N-acetylglucosaminidase